MLHIHVNKTEIGHTKTEEMQKNFFAKSRIFISHSVIYCPIHLKLLQ